MSMTFQLRQSRGRCRALPLAAGILLGLWATPVVAQQKDDTVGVGAIAPETRRAVQEQISQSTVNVEILAALPNDIESDVAGALKTADYDAIPAAIARLVGAHPERALDIAVTATRALPAAAPITMGAPISEAVPGTISMNPEASAIAQQPPGSFDPRGVRWRSFLAYPRAVVDTTHNDNIFATDGGKTADTIATLRPSVSLRSDWNNHAISISGTGVIKQYFLNESENVTDGAIAANGRLDILQNVYATAEAGIQSIHEDRTSPDSIDAQNSPTRYRLASTRLGFVRDRGRIGLRIDGGIDLYRYSDGVDDNGTIIRQTDRDRSELLFVPRLTYRVTERYSAFIQAPMNWRNYRRRSFATGRDRDTAGREIGVGASVNVTGTITGEFFAGLVRQRYDGPPGDRISDFTVGGNVSWSATPLTSVRGALSRTVQDTIFANAMGYLQTNLNAGVDHLLRDNVVINAAAGIANQKYQGFARRDRVFDASVGARYLFNRFATAGVSAGYRRRATTFAGEDFRQLILSVSVTGQY